MSSIFRGASAEQDSRFSDKAKKLLRTTKFPSNFDSKVDMKKVNLESMLPWITEQVIKLLGNDDDVVIGYIQARPTPPSLAGAQQEAGHAQVNPQIPPPFSPCPCLSSLPTRPPSPPTPTLTLIRAPSRSPRLTPRSCS